MAGIARFSASVDGDLLDRFDRLCGERGYPTRSKALESVMRRAVMESAPGGRGTLSGAVTLVYDHHRRSIVNRLLEVQHDAGDVVVCTQHVHLDHHNCLEVLIVRGSPESIRTLLAGLNSIKGLETSSLMVESTESEP